MKNHLTSMTKIKKEFPLFFKKSTMEAFNSKILKPIKVTDIGTYFITSEIYHKDNKEENRVYNLRLATCIFRNKNENNIYTIKKYKTINEACIVLDKLLHDNGGFSISFHEANKARLNILNRTKEFSNKKNNIEEVSKINFK